MTKHLQAQLPVATLPIFIQKYRVKGGGGGGWLHSLTNPLFLALQLTANQILLWEGGGGGGGGGGGLQAQPPFPLDLCM